MNSIKDKIQIGVAVVLLAGVLVFGYMKISKLVGLYQYTGDVDNAIISVDSTIAGLDETITEAKLVFQETNNLKNEEMAGVFPTEEDLTSLNRAFDDFSASNNFSNDPFFVSNISYKDSSASADGNYSVLPFSMRVESSEDNFYKFLEYIETSGNLDNKVRLMNVTDVAINISTEDEELISYNLELNAYFQK